MAEQDSFGEYGFKLTEDGEQRYTLRRLDLTTSVEPSRQPEASPDTPESGGRVRQLAKRLGNNVLTFMQEAGKTLRTPYGL